MLFCLACKSVPVNCVLVKALCSFINPDPWVSVHPLNARENQASQLLHGTCLSPFFIPVKRVIKKRPHDSMFPTVRTGQHPWFRPRRMILTSRIGYCAFTSWDCRFRCGNNNVNLIYLQPYLYRAWQVELCHLLGKLARCPLWVLVLLVLLEQGVVLLKPPSHTSIPQIRVARWPNTPVVRRSLLAQSACA